MRQLTFGQKSEVSNHRKKGKQIMQSVQLRSVQGWHRLRRSFALLLALLLLGTQVSAVQAQGQSRAQRINFAPGAITATRTGVLTMGGSDRYVLKASGGQTMSVSVASATNNVDLVIFGKADTVLR